MKIFLTKEQARILESALDSYVTSLEKSARETPPVNQSIQNSVDERLFQCDLLVQYFRKQREFDE